MEPAETMHTTPTTRLFLRLLTAVAVVVLTAVGPGGRVAAHAELLEITPADGEVLDAAPQEVVLRFSEPVSLTGGSASVLDDQATVVSDAAHERWTTSS